MSRRSGDHTWPLYAKGGYFNSLMKSRRLAQLVSMSLYPNAKEFTESCAVYTAIKRFCPWSLDDPTITAIVVGDGNTPRTGATIAVQSAWTVHSSDPVLRHAGAHAKVERLIQHRKCAERVLYPHKHRVVLAAPHSHANLRHVIASIKDAEIFVVSLPCCVPDGLGTPLRQYDDEGCLSPKRTVKIYHVRQE